MHMRTSHVCDRTDSPNHGPGCASVRATLYPCFTSGGEFSPFSCVKRHSSSRVLLRPGHSLKTDPRCGHARLCVILFGCCVLLLLLLHLPFVLALSAASALCVFYDPLLYSARFLMFCMLCFVQLSVLNISFLKYNRMNTTSSPSYY